MVSSETYLCTGHNDGSHIRRVMGETSRRNPQGEGQGQVDFRLTRPGRDTDLTARCPWSWGFWFTVDPLGVVYEKRRLECRTVRRVTPRVGTFEFKSRDLPQSTTSGTVASHQPQPRPPPDHTPVWSRSICPDKPRTSYRLRTTVLPGGGSSSSTPSPRPQSPVGRDG